MQKTETERNSIAITYSIHAPGCHAEIQNSFTSFKFRSASLCIFRHACLLLLH